MDEQEFLLGLLGGSSDIGNSLINLSTFYPRLLNPEWNRQNKDRENSLNDFNNRDNTSFKAGRIAGNIAGTAGAGAGFGGLLRGLSRTPQALSLAESIIANGSGTPLNRMMGLLGSGSSSYLLANPSY